MSFRKFFYVALVSTLLSNALAATDPFAPPVPLYIEGNQYVTAYPDKKSDKPTVMEFFSFGCPHCYHAEDQVNHWLSSKPDNVEYIKIPVGFGRPSWVLFARAYYISKALKIEEQSIPAFFSLIHEKKQPPKDKTDLKQFFLSQGVSEEDFEKNYGSFYVESSLKKADQLATEFKISGVPTFIASNRYTLGKEINSQEEFDNLLTALALKDFK